MAPQRDCNLVEKAGIVSHSSGYNCDKLPEGKVACSMVVHISP